MSGKKKSKKELFGQWSVSNFVSLVFAVLLNLFLVWNTILFIKTSLMNSYLNKEIHFFTFEN